MGIFIWVYRRDIILWLYGVNPWITRKSYSADTDNTGRELQDGGEVHQK